MQEVRELEQVLSLLESSEQNPLWPTHFRLLEGQQLAPEQLWRREFLVGVGQRKKIQKPEDWLLVQQISEPQEQQLPWLRIQRPLILPS